MDIFPIWKSTFYETEEDSVKFRILKWGVQEICRATAVRLPDDELLRIGLNKPCQGYLDSNIDVSDTGTTSSNAYAEFSLQIWNASNSQWFNAYEFAFVNDWSYGEHEETGSFSEPINGHAAPGQLIPYTICSTSTTQETICYDEYEFTAYLTVNPSTIAFDQTGGTATITIFSNTNWYITQYGNLVSLSQYQGGSGTTTVTVTCGENLVIREFTDTLRIRADKRGTTAIEYVHITQEAATPYVNILSGGDAIFDTSGSTWTVVYQTNIPRLYYEMSDGTNTITGYTSGGRVSFNLPPVTGNTSYTLNFYDEPGGTLYATATAEQTIYYFNFYNSDYAAVMNTDTAYTVTWDTNYTSVTLVYGEERITTSNTAATFTFEENTGDTDVIYVVYVYSDNGRLIGTLHWRQLSVYAGEYLTIETGGYTGTTNVIVTFTTDHGSAPIYVSMGAGWLDVSPGDPWRTSAVSGTKFYLKNAGLPGVISVSLAAEGSYVKVYGNYMSLEYGDDFAGKTEFENGWSSFVRFAANTRYADKLVLPASNAVSGNWGEGCYHGMFKGCTLLETAPMLSATVLGDYCYKEIFAGCTSLTTAPSLYADVVGEHSYEAMFSGCTSLTQAGSLLASTLSEYSCKDMFAGCTSLTTAPSLYVENLAEHCYDGMFKGTSITSAPVLNVQNVPDNAYTEMFSGCSQLSRIECYAVDNDDYSSRFAAGWAYGVAPTGTFVQAAEMENWLAGVNGNPWYFMPQPAINTGQTGQYNTQYTTLEILTDGKLCFNSLYNLNYSTHRINQAELYYSINGRHWQPAFYAVDNIYDRMHAEPFEIDVYEGTTILLKGSYGDRWTAVDYIKWSPSFSGSTAEFNVYGNALSLVYGDWFREHTTLDGTMACAFSHLFESSKVVSAEDFEMPTGYYPQKAMFEAFRDCPLLTDGPVINCTSYASIAFTETFYQCTSLQSIKMPMLANVGSDGFARWVYNVPAGGTFTKHPDAVYPTTAPAQSWIPNSIPDGWTVINA